MSKNEPRSGTDRMRSTSSVKGRTVVIALISVAALAVVYQAQQRKRQSSEQPSPVGPDIATLGYMGSCDSGSDCDPTDLYMDLMKLSLTDLVYEKNPKLVHARIEGRDWPGRALTMIGLKRMDNLLFAMDDVVARGVPGDFIEAGAWRGGATIFMRAFLKARGVKDRVVWVADSFEGLPKPDTEQYPVDESLGWLHDEEVLAVSLEEVKSNFERYGLLDDQVRFLKGWFKDTLPTAPIQELAILRLDGDLYESTMDTLVHLYPKLAPGGLVIVDDYRNIAQCGKATDDYREKHGITAEIKPIDRAGVYWQKD